MLLSKDLQPHNPFLLHGVSPKMTVFDFANPACSDTINATLNSQGDATVDTPQFLASLLTPHFDLTCSPVSGKKRRGKRDLTNDDKSCIVDSAFSLATFAASNLQVQNAMSTIPLNFDVKGGLIDVKTQVRVKIQQRPSQFTARIFSPQQISSTIAYFATLAGYVEKEGPGVPITHIVFTLSDSETQATASCSSWTFTWTSPKPSQTIIVSSNCLVISFESDVLLAGQPMHTRPDRNRLRRD